MGTTELLEHCLQTLITGNSFYRFQSIDLKVNIAQA